MGRTTASRQLVDPLRNHLQHRQLVAQQKDLDLVLGVGAVTQRYQAEKMPEQPAHA